MQSIHRARRSSSDSSNFSPRSIPLLTIASLALREAARRRIILVAGIAGILLVAGSAWGLARLVASVPVHVAALGIVSILTIFLAFVFSVVLSMGAAFLAAPAIAGDIESGIALVLLPRPLSRGAFVIGKWLGLIALVALFATGFGAAEAGAIALVTGYVPPHPFVALGFLIAQSVVTLSFALLLSTRLGSVASGLLAMASFGVAWIAGITASIADSLHNDTVVHAATLVELAFPTDGLWRGAVYALQPVTMILAARAASGNVPNPFGAATPPPPALIAWSGLWIAAALSAAVVSFTRRDV